MPGYTTAMFKLNSDRDIVYAEVAQKEMIRPLSTDSEQVVCRMRYVAYTDDNGYDQCFCSITDKLLS